MCIKLARVRGPAAWTLVEFIVAMSVGLILTVMLVAFMLYTGFSLAGILNYVELESQSQQTLDSMISDVREVDRLTDFASNKLTFAYNSGSNTLSYVYSSSARTLTCTKAGTNKILLRECDSLTFAIYQRSPLKTNIYDLYPTTLSATNCKAIQVKWSCSRKILGSKLNTETVQSTKIVLRN